MGEPLVEFYLEKLCEYISDFLRGILNQLVGKIWIYCRKNNLLRATIFLNNN